MSESIDLSAGPAPLVAAMSSVQTETGSTFFAGFVIQPTDQLCAAIASAYDLLMENPTICKIQLHCDGVVLPGSDYYRLADSALSESEQEQLEDVLNALSEGGARAVASDEVALFNSASANGIGGMTLTISKYSPPSIRVHEKYSYEEFTSGNFEELSPPAQQRFLAAIYAPQAPGALACPEATPACTA